jgi:hypothetical protein
MSKILCENLNQITRRNEKIEYLLSLVFKEDGIALDRALSFMMRDLGVNRLEALLSCFDSEEEGFITVELNSALKPSLWLTPKGLKWIFRSHQLAGYTAQNYLVEARGGGID